MHQVWSTDGEREVRQVRACERERLSRLSPAEQDLRGDEEEMAAPPVLPSVQIGVASLASLMAENERLKEEVARLRSDLFQMRFVASTDVSEDYDEPFNVKEDG